MLTLPGGVSQESPRYRNMNLPGLPYSLPNLRIKVNLDNVFYKDEKSSKVDLKIKNMLAFLFMDGYNSVKCYLILVSTCGGLGLSPRKWSIINKFRGVGWWWCNVFFLGGGWVGCG